MLRPQSLKKLPQVPLLFQVGSLCRGRADRTPTCFASQRAEPEPEPRPEGRSADRNLLGHLPCPAPEVGEPRPVPPDSVTSTGDSPSLSPGFILFAAGNR